MASASNHNTYTIFYGPVINPVSLTSYSILPQCLLVVDPFGKIDFIMGYLEAHKLQETLASKGHSDVDVTILKDGEFLMPGFIDTHTVRVHSSDCTRYGS